jgi:hypothetical protein
MEYKYDCSICWEDNILESNIVYLQCLHYLCLNCFTKLISLTCPFCREEICLNNNRNDIFIVENDYHIPEHLLQNDFIIPFIRKDRHENKRKKINKKRQNLNNIMENDFLTIADIPNPKHRTNRKYNILSVSI